MYIILVRMLLVNLSLLFLLTNCGSQKNSTSSSHNSSDAMPSLMCAVGSLDEKVIEKEKPASTGKTTPDTPKTPVKEDDYYDLAQEIRKVPGNGLKLKYKEKKSSLCEIIAAESTDYLIVHLIPADCEDCVKQTMETQTYFDSDRRVKQLLVDRDSQELEDITAYPDLAIDAEGIFESFFKLENNYKILIMDKYSQGFLSLPEDAKEEFASFQIE